MLHCTNRRLNDEGREEDPLTFEPIIPDQVFTLERNGRRFCYDIFGLVQYINNQQQRGLPVVIPETRVPITANEIQSAFSFARSRMPQVYAVMLPGHSLPYLFSNSASAIAFNRRRRGRIHQLGVFDQANLPELLYSPNAPLGGSVSGMAMDRSVIRDNPFNQVSPPSSASASASLASEDQRRLNSNAFEAEDDNSVNVSGFGSPVQRGRFWERGL